MVEQNDIMAWTPRDEEKQKEDLYDAVFEAQAQAQPLPQDQTNLDMNANMNMMPWIPKNEDDIRKFIYDYQISDEMQAPMQATPSGMNLNGGHDYGHYRDHDHDHDSLMATTPDPTPIVRPFNLPNRARSPSKMPGPVLDLGMGMGMGCLASVPASVPASASGSNSHLSGVHVRNGMEKADIDRIDDFLRTCTISERPEQNGSVGSEPVSLILSNPFRLFLLVFGDFVAGDDGGLFGYFFSFLFPISFLICSSSVVLTQANHFNSVVLVPLT